MAGFFLASLLLVRSFVMAILQASDQRYTYCVLLNTLLLTGKNVFNYPYPAGHRIYIQYPPRTFIVFQRATQPARHHGQRGNTEDWH